MFNASVLICVGAAVALISSKRGLRKSTKSEKQMRRLDRNEIHLSRHSHLTSYGRTTDGGPTTDSDRRRAEDTHNGGRPTERRRKEIGGPTTDNEGQATDDHRQLTDNQCARCLLWPWCHVELDTETIKKRISDLLCRNANRYEHTPRMQVL